MQKGDTVFVSTRTTNEYSTGFFGTYQGETEEGCLVFITHDEFGEPLHPVISGTREYSNDDVHEAEYVINDNLDWLEEKLNYMKAFKDEQQMQKTARV